MKPRRLVNKNILEYFKATAFLGIIYIVFSIYLYYRRGFYDLYIVNKILAGVAVVSLGCILMIGPLSRMFDRFRGFVVYRKKLGIIAFMLAASHGTSSFFYLEKYFPRSYFFETYKLSFSFGLVAIGILTVLFIASFEYVRMWLTPKKWWPLHYWGIRVGFVIVGLHIAAMKYKGWVEWYIKGGASTLKHPDWPGLGSLIAWFMLLVIVFRVSDAINHRAGKTVAYIFLPILMGIYIFTFMWGRQFIAG